MLLEYYVLFESMLNGEKTDDSKYCLGCQIKFSHHNLSNCISNVLHLSVFICLSSCFGEKIVQVADKYIHNHLQ